MRAKTAKRSQDTKKIKARKLITELNENYMLSLQSGSESMRHFIKTGVIANTLKESIKHGNFKQTIESDLEHIDIRQLQRAMKLVKHFEFRRFEALYYVPKSHLERIIRKAGKAGVTAYLEENNVKLEVDLEDETNFQIFLKHMKLLSAIDRKKFSKTKKDNKFDDDDNDVEEEKNYKVKKNTPTTFLMGLKKLRINKKEKRESMSEKQLTVFHDIYNELNLIFIEFGDDQL